MNTPALIDTASGEVLELAPERLELAQWTPADLATLRDRLGDVKRAIDAVLADVDHELVIELDRANTRTGQFGDWKVETNAPLETIWDERALRLALEKLVQADKITRAAATAALEPVTTYKPRDRELTKLLAHADVDVIEAVDACRRAELRARRRVTVKRTMSA